MNWDRFWSLQPESLILWLAVLAALIAVAAYLVLKIRGKTLQSEPPASELLSKFRDLHSQGELTRRRIPNYKNDTCGATSERVKQRRKTG